MLKFIRTVAIISSIFGIIFFMLAFAAFLSHERVLDAILLVAFSTLLGSSLITLALLEQNK